MSKWLLLRMFWGITECAELEHFYNYNGNPNRDFAQSKEINPQPILLSAWMKENWKSLIPA